MKRTFLIIAFLMFYFVVSGQDYKVESVEHLLGDFTAREHVKKDDKGRQCAVLRVSTRGIPDNEKQRFHFESDFGSQIVEKSLNKGEIWVWVSPGIKTLKINHEKLGSYEIHFIDYLHDAVQSLHTYKISIKGEGGQIKSGFGNLEMVTNPAGATIVMDGSEFPSKTPYKIPITAGFHEVEFSKYKYKNKIESFEIEKDSTLKLVVDLEPDYAIITLITDSDANMYKIANDTAYLGTGRKSKEFRSGTYTILTKRYMCFDTVQTIMVVGGKDEEIQLVRPRVNFSEITMITDSDVSLTIDDEPVGKGGKIKKMLSGKHKIASKCDMCFDTIQEINVVAGHDETIELVRPRKNYAMITFVTDSDVQLQVDNEKIGNGQKTRKLLSGKHTVFSKRSMCIDTIQEILVVAGKDETIELARPKINYGNIKITTDKDAKILINGDVVAWDGDYESKLESGRYKIVCKKENYIDAVRNVVLNVGDNLKLDMMLQPNCGKLDVKSDPSGAFVSIDGKVRGHTPLLLNDVIVGRHTVIIDKQDYTSASKTVNVTLNEISHVDVKLVPNIPVEISTNKNGSAIHIDGKMVGYSPYKGYITSGQHKIKAVYGKLTETTNVEVTANGYNNFYLTLRDKNAVKKDNQVEKYSNYTNKKKDCIFAKNSFFVTANLSVGTLMGVLYGLSVGMDFGDDRMTSGFYLSYYRSVDYGYSYSEKVHGNSYVVGFLSPVSEKFRMRFGVGYRSLSCYGLDDSKYLNGDFLGRVFFPLGVQWLFNKFTISADLQLFEIKVGIGYNFRY